MNEIASGFQRDQVGSLPDLLGFEWTHAQDGVVEGRFEIRKHHLAPIGYLHAATIVALADTACGYGCKMMLPDAAVGFTTAELKTNFLGTAREGFVTVQARIVHGGRTTQVWDAEVVSEVSGKTLALFRCTQIVLYKPQGQWQHAEKKIHRSAEKLKAE